LTTTRTSKPRPPPEDVRRAILTATRTLFLAKGYAGTSTDEIAALSAVSKQTIYRHFSDKDDLIAAVFNDAITAAEAQGAEAFDAMAGTEDLERDLRLFARGHIRDVMQPHILQMRRRIIGEVARFPKLALAWYDAGPKRGHQKLQQCFEALRDRGLLQVDDSALAAELFNWLILSIPLNRAMFDAEAVFETEKFDDYADEAVRVFLAAYGRR
jgi:TetR/AcrR family transcriptional regulator, mexJK operon transcriptional repressor